MEKISRILPASSRFTVADGADNLPARPGSPQFGRDVGSNSIHDRVTKSSLAGSSQADFQTYKEPRNATKTRIAEDIAKRFFIERDQDVKLKAEQSAQETVREPDSQFVVLPIMLVPSDKLGAAPSVGISELPDSGVREISSPMETAEYSMTESDQMFDQEA